MKYLEKMVPQKIRFFSLLLALGACGWTHTAAADEVVITDEARTHFRAGVNLMQDPDGARYAEAFAEFRLAYQESPSWKILGNLGLCAMKLERDGEAIEAYEKYLEGGGNSIEASEREQIERDLQTMRAGVTWVTISSVPTGASVTDNRIPVAGRPTENRYDALGEARRIGVRAGRHEITVSLDGYESETWSFDARGGELEHVFELKEVVDEPAPVVGSPPPAQPAEPVRTERPVPVGVYVGLGLTGAFAAGATATGIVALGKNKQFNQENGVDRNKAEDLRTSGQTLNLVTDILIGGAVVAAGTTVILYFTRPEVTVQPKDNGLRGPRLLAASPTVLPGGGGMWLSGEF